MTTAACNACHGKLAIHGRRVEAQYCTVCHTDQPQLGSVVRRQRQLLLMVHGLHAAGR